MTVPDSFQTVAEISIAFAGFSGLIVALRRRTGPLTEVEKFRLQVLLGLSFGAMFLSFLPAWLGLAGVNGPALWTGSSGVLALYSLIFIVWWTARSRRLARIVPEIFNWYAFARMSAGHLAVLLAQLAVIFSLVGGRAPALYLLALIWYLLHAAQQFARMLFVQPREERRQPETPRPSAGNT